MKCAVIWSNDQDARNTGIAGIATLAHTSLCRPWSWIQSLIAVYPDIPIFLYFPPARQDHCTVILPSSLRMAILAPFQATSFQSVVRHLRAVRQPGYYLPPRSYISIPKQQTTPFLRIAHFAWYLAPYGASVEYPPGVSIPLTLSEMSNGRRTHCLPEIDVLDYQIRDQSIVFQEVHPRVED